MKRHLLSSAVATALLLSGCGPKSSQEYIDTANTYLQQGEPEAAVLELKNAISRAESDAQLRLLLGKAYIDTGEMAGAEKELQRALTLAPSLASEITPLMFDVLLSSNQLSEVMTLDIGNASACAECSLIKGWAALNTEAGQNVELAPLLQDQASWKAELLSAYQSGDQPKLREVLQAHSQDVLSAKVTEQLVFAQIALLTRESKLAFDTYQTVLKTRPKLFWVRIPLAQASLAQENYDEALKYLNGVLALDKRHPFANYMRGLIQMRRGQMEEANVSAENAINYGYDTPGSRLLMGIVQYRQEKNEQALNNLKIATANLPPDHFAHQLLISTELKLGYTSDAAAKLAAKEDKNLMDVSLIGLSVSALQDNEDEAALKQLLGDSLSSIPGENAFIKQQKGLIKLSLGDESGMTELDQAYQETEQSGTVFTARAVFKLRQGDVAGALAELDAWHQQDSDNVEPLNIAGAVLFSQGDIAAAEAKYQQALSVAENNAPSLFFQVKKYIGSGEFEQALTASEALLGAHPLHMRGLQLHILLSRNLEKGLDRSIELALAATKTPQSNIQHQLTLASLYASAGFDALAQRTLAELDEEALEARLQYWELRFYLAAKNKDARQAKTVYDEWRRRWPGQPQSYVNYSDFLVKQGDTEEAARVIATGSRQLPENDTVKAFEALVLLQGNNLRKARRILDELDSNGQESPIQLYLNGYYYSLSNEVGRALDYLSRHYDMTGGAHSAFLISRIKLSRGEDIREFLETHLQAQPNDLMNRRLLAETYIGLENLKAMEHYAALIERLPDYAEGMNNYAWLLNDQGNAAEAREWAEKALAIDGENLNFLDTYATILSSSKAYADLESALAAKYDASPQLTLFYAEALISQGKGAQAKQVLLAAEAGMNDQYKRRYEMLLNQAG